MTNLLKSLSIAGLLALTAGTASAQGLNFSVGVADDRPSRMERRMERDMRDDGDIRIERRRGIDDVSSVRRRVIEEDDTPVVSRRIIERRVMRPAPTRVVCRTEIQRTVRANGVIVTRPREVCRTQTVSTSRRVFVD